jgi:6-phosphogluconolactonase (cycloisomerase 2 family)
MLPDLDKDKEGLEKEQQRFMRNILTAALMCGFAVANAAGQAGEAAGAVFVATNDVNHNAVIMYSRSASGTLTYVGSFETGGRGQGGINDPLQSQSSLLLSSDHKYLLAVNAGSSTLSVFQVFYNGLRLIETTPTEGGNPVSIAMHDDLVYVANVGGTYHTAGFHMNPFGELEFIQNSKQHLSGLDTEPGTIAFSPDGSKLIVTERQTNNIDVFSVASDGSLTNGVVTAAQGVEPFGAAFAPSGALLVSEAGSGAVSSYSVNADNSLTAITSKSPSSGVATCWVIPGGEYAYASSAITSSISGYKLGSAGDLSPLGIIVKTPGTQPAIFPPIGVTAFPMDVEITPDNKFLYVVYSALGQVVGYQAASDGTLTQVTSVSPYAAQIGVEGLAVY